MAQTDLCCSLLILVALYDVESLLVPSMPVACVLSGICLSGCTLNTYMPHRPIDQPPMACVSDKLRKMRSKTSRVQPCFGIRRLPLMLF